MQSLVETMAATAYAIGEGDHLGRTWGELPEADRRARCAGMAAALRDVADLEAIGGRVLDAWGVLAAAEIEAAEVVAECEAGDGGREARPHYSAQKMTARLAEHVWRRTVRAAVQSWAAADPAGAAMLAGRGQA